MSTMMRGPHVIARGITLNRPFSAKFEERTESRWLDWIRPQTAKGEYLRDRNGRIRQDYAMSVLLGRPARFGYLVDPTRGVCTVMDHGRRTYFQVSFRAPTVEGVEGTPSGAELREI